MEERIDLQTRNLAIVLCSLNDIFAGNLLQHFTALNVHNFDNALTGLTVIADRQSTVRPVEFG